MLRLKRTVASAPIHVVVLALVMVLAGSASIVTAQDEESRRSRIPNTEGYLINLPIGGTGVFAAEDAAGNTWTQEFNVAGAAGLLSTYTLYWVLDVTTFRPDPETEVILVRSTPTEVFDYVGLDQETMTWYDGPVGTTWSREFPDGRIVEVEIMAVETVTVPAGTYTDCVKYRKRCLTCSEPNAEWFEWIKPGFFLVKWVDNWEENPPAVYELTEFSAP